MHPMFYTRDDMLWFYQMAKSRTGKLVNIIDNPLFRVAIKIVLYSLLRLSRIEHKVKSWFSGEDYYNRAAWSYRELNEELDEYIEREESLLGLFFYILRRQ